MSEKMMASISMEEYLNLTTERNALRTQLAASNRAREEAEQRAAKFYEALREIADFTNGYGDVAGIVYKKACAAVSGDSAPVAGKVVALVDRVWDALRERCCATKPHTDAKRVVMVSREDLEAAWNKAQAGVR